MIGPMLDALESVLFDFHGTLSSGHYFRTLGAETKARISQLLFGIHSDDWVDPWMAGELDSVGICHLLAEHLGLKVSVLQDALYDGCAHMAFNPSVLGMARECRARGLLIGLVTVNMDVFSEVVVPAHGLAELFHAIINSADFGSLDKELLWDAAFDALGATQGYAGSLVIEDSLANVERFRALGGMAYHYASDDALDAWRATSGV